MNKRILMGLATLCVFLGVSNIANAGCDGVYLGVRGGVYDPRVDSKNKLYTLGKNSWLLSGAIGYRYEYVRAELEATVRGRPETKINLGGSTAKEKFEATSYMVNFYWDLSPYTMFTPYLNAGLGQASLEATVKTTGMVNTTATHTEDNFSWNVGGGVSAKVTTRLNVDLGYRYFNFGKLNGMPIISHEGYLGVRYVF